MKAKLHPFLRTYVGVLESQQNRLSEEIDNISHGIETLCEEDNVRYTLVFPDGRRVTICKGTELEMYALNSKGEYTRRPIKAVIVKMNAGMAATSKGMEPEVFITPEDKYKHACEVITERGDTEWVFFEELSSAGYASGWDSPQGCFARVITPPPAANPEPAIQTFSHNDVRMTVYALDMTGETQYVTVWRIKGSPEPYAYPTKTAAEVAARQMFPNETEEQRYARIYFIDFFAEN